ncbi:gliding motility-associated C-terminal domain-containing protein [Flavobacterium taihuense]|uniref:Gliding motility-associated C-terminal domain-containing protein n=1 Tax=Flavobacterium taihuense TaxID=2857508 RepID=A0ABS6XYM0_9FLAO|nr:gliding motility-associated C-terminal domain-containing protein [Flavobacterium taihuense]MBW4361778.1 gliding motility-associated C-terminal domain-containing protein [Flavobacterium taihuense]
MVPKLLFSDHFKLVTYLSFCILFFYSIDINAQCAGDDGIKDVCNIPDPSSSVVDLFSALGGSPLTGGTWNDDNNSGGLDLNTGVLNVQKIKKSGIYKYTYTVPGITGCGDNTAVVTVTVGGYTGVPAPNASICSSETAYNLFQVFEGLPNLSPQIGGLWHDNDNSGGLNPNAGTLNASVPTPNDTYSYNYSIDAIGSCPAPPPVQIFVSIYRAPEPGKASNLLLCSNQLGGYTNFDLNSQLAGADPGGTWSESGTSEISSSLDSNIDIQNIYNTKGPGAYRFTYTVISNNTVCINESSSVDVIIEKQLDFTGSTLEVSSDICEDKIPTASYTGILKQGAQSIPNGVYDIVYTISGVSSPLISRQNFVNGVLIFPIPSINFQQAKDYTIHIIKITDANNFEICNYSLGIIEDVLHIYPIPKIDAATLTISPVCQSSDALVNFSGTSNLADGNYDILYNLSGGNILNGIPAFLNVIGGLSSFSIPAAFIQKVGTTTVTIAQITNPTTDCTNISTLKQDFTVNPLPDVSKLAITIKNVCQGQSARVELKGLGTLTAIDINYSLSGVNTLDAQTIPLTVLAGVSSFVIPATDIPMVGTTTFTVSVITNTVTGCTLSFNRNVDFIVNSIPNIPTAADVQSFCTADNATVANLKPQGSKFQWFDSVTSTVPLIATTPLIVADYFVKEVNASTGCESSLKMVSVLINETPVINDATLIISPICQTSDAFVGFSGTSNLADGNYDILYDVSGANIAFSIPAVLSITGGSGSFIIPSSLISIAGSNTLSIIEINNSATQCSSTSTLKQDFIVNLLPDVANLIVTTKDVCQGQSAKVELKGLGTLTSIEINYTLSGVNTVGVKTIPLAVVAGETSFFIPATDIPIGGITTFTITDITNTITGCTLAINNKTNFSVNPIPNTPVAVDIQTFCTADNATVANLMPQGNQYQWFDMATSTVPLIATTTLITSDYFVKEVNVTTGCESSLKGISVIINATPDINDATLTILPICQGSDASVLGSTSLMDGNYNILYNLSDSNIVNAVSANVIVTSGLFSFPIPSNLIPKSGNTTIAITSIINQLTSCANVSNLTKVFVVNPLPDVSNMVVTVKDGCLGQDVNVDIAGLGTLTNISLNYAVTGANTIVSQTVSLLVVGGNTNFLIPAANLLSTGENTLAITDLTNIGNSCSTIINSVSQKFTINAIPSSPTADNHQPFCETELATVGNLVPSGNQYKWFDTPISTTPLNSNVLLVTADYYLKEENLTTACRSLPTPISVLINVVPTPVLKSNGEDFCGADKPTIQNLSNNTIASGNLKWYDAAINGIVLTNTHLLAEGVTYYGFDYDTAAQCYSSPLPVAVSLTDCTVTPDDLAIPDGFSPNGDGVNDTFQIVDIEFLYPNYTLEIFNRYGNLLFKGNINKPAWDGKNSNSSFIDGDAPTGVYFYIINYNKENLPPEQGQLYLNR